MDHFFGLENRHFSPKTLTQRSREQEIVTTSKDQI